MTPLVLVHGFMGGGAQWADQVDFFGEQYRVIAVDLPGFGARHTEPAPDTIGGFAEAVLGDLDRLGVGDFALLGHSMGGMVVQEMVARAPERVRTLVLYGTGPTGALKERFESFETSRQRATADGARATARRISATWFLQGEAAPGYPGCAAIAEQASLAAIHAGLHAMERWRGIAQLSDIACPTLVLWGDRDRTYAWAQIERLWQGIPGAALAVVPGAAHAVHLEAPALFNALLARHLDQHPN